jgi:glutamate racemase
LIGVFDSGVGGLAVLREIRRLMPSADLLYLADQAHAPYGERRLEEVARLAGNAADHLIERGARVIVVACNTASAAALDHLRNTRSGVRFVGMEPAVKPAAAATRSRVVGVLATPTTFRAEVLDRLVGRFARGIRVLPHACPGWADMVEATRPEGAHDPIAEHLAPLLEAGADTLVLACTHYSFLAGVIARIAGPEVTVIDPAPAVARQVARVADPTGGGATTFVTTGDADLLSAQVERLLGVRVAAEATRIGWRSTGHRG